MRKNKPISNVEQYIPTGQQNAISMRRLSDLAGATQRATRAAVNRARIEDGVPIIGDDNGYYLPESDAELMRYLQRKRCQCRTTQAVIDCVEANLAGTEAP